MAKPLQMNATILYLKPQGESNNSVCFLSQTEGIMFATLYGGRKSRLKSLVSPWNTGNLWLTQDTKTSFYKISDFSVSKYHTTFRENLVKYYASSLAAELAIKTKCAGSAKDFWALFNGFIDGLELCTTEEDSQKGLLRFLWRFLSLSGLLPDATECSRCQTSFLTGKTDGDKVSYSYKGAVFSVTENNFFCSECALPEERSLFYLDGDAIRYLAGISTLSAKDARSLPVSDQGENQIKELLFYLVESSIGTSLKTLKTAKGIL